MAAENVGADRRFAFRFVGHGIWEFALESEFGRSGMDLKGLEFLARLLSRPNERISPLELSLAKEPESVRWQAEQDRPDDLLDAEAVRSLNRRKKWLEERLAISEDSELEIELRQIVQTLKRATRPGGGRTKSRSSELRKACQRVQNAINRALEAIRASGMSSLADHLQECSRPDKYFFVYRQANPPNWDVNWLR